jgi:hypothetical protein
MGCRQLADPKADETHSRCIAKKIDTLKRG